MILQQFCVDQNDFILFFEQNSVAISLRRLWNLDILFFF